MVIVEKKNGEHRFTLDLIKLNNLVELDEFQILKIEEIIRSLGEAAHFSVLDLKDGFWQVRLRMKDREKTVFLDANNRLLQLKKMPQDFKNTPAIFQREMYMILKGLIEKNASCISMLYWSLGRRSKKIFQR